MPPQRAILRLIDANANRALEGLRVCEDVVRFGLEAAPEFRRLRRLRHAIADAVTRLPVTSRDRVIARDSRQDPGRRAAAGRLQNLEHMLVVNLQRVKEALRALEECARLFGPRHTASFQRLRFDVYDLERRLMLQLDTVRHS